MSENGLTPKTRLRRWKQILFTCYHYNCGKENVSLALRKGLCVVDCEVGCGAVSRCSDPPKTPTFCVEMTCLKLG